MRKPKEPTVGNYTKSVNDAIAKLKLAITYADDGATFDGARCASEGVVKLFEAASIRMRMLET